MSDTDFLSVIVDTLLNSKFVMDRLIFLFIIFCRSTFCIHFILIPYLQCRIILFTGKNLCIWEYLFVWFITSLIKHRVSFCIFVIYILLYILLVSMIEFRQKTEDNHDTLLLYFVFIFSFRKLYSAVTQLVLLVGSCELQQQLGAHV